MKGIIAPVVTAFHQNREIDFERSIAHCRWLLEHGCDRLAVFGTTSEANSLSVLERKRLLEAIVRSGISAAQLLVGNGSCALPDAVELAKHALQIGCGGVLMLPPFYYKTVRSTGFSLSSLSSLIASPTSDCTSTIFRQLPRSEFRPL